MVDTPQHYRCCYAQIYLLGIKAWFSRARSELSVPGLAGMDAPGHIWYFQEMLILVVLPHQSCSSPTCSVCVNIESKGENIIIPRHFPPHIHGWVHARPHQNYRDCESTVHGVAHTKYHRPHDPVSLKKYFNTLFNGSEVQHQPSYTTVPAQKHEVFIIFSNVYQLSQVFLSGCKEKAAWWILGTCKGISQHLAWQKGEKSK